MSLSCLFDCGMFNQVPIEDQGYGRVVVRGDERYGRSESCWRIWSRPLFDLSTPLSDPHLQCLRDSFPKRNVNHFSAAGLVVRACGSKEVTQYGVMPRLHRTTRKGGSTHTENSSLFARRPQYHWTTRILRHPRPRKGKRRIQQRKVLISAKHYLYGRT